MGYYADAKAVIRGVHSELSQRDIAVAVAYLASGCSPEEAVTKALAARRERAEWAAAWAKRDAAREAAEADRLLGEDYTSLYDNNWE